MTFKLLKAFKVKKVSFGEKRSVVEALERWREAEVVGRTG